MSCLGSERLAVLFLNCVEGALLIVICVLMSLHRIFCFLLEKSHRVSLTAAHSPLSPHFLSGGKTRSYLHLYWLHPMFLFLLDNCFSVCKGPMTGTLWEQNQDAKDAMQKAVQS